jgi:hypothetical protein
LRKKWGFERSLQKRRKKFPEANNKYQKNFFETALNFPAWLIQVAFIPNLALNYLAW